MVSETASRGSDPLVAIIEPHREALVAICRCFGVRRLDLFGSAAQGHFDPATSDLDFIAEFADAGDRGYAMRYLHFAEALEGVFGRPVDLLTERMIGNQHFREALDRTRRRIYG